MKTKKNYNWWEDPKNKKEAERLSWWNHAENKENINFPISIVKKGKIWIATCNDETKELLGDRLHGCSQGKTKKEAINHLFKLIKITHEYAERCSHNYQRWVPFRKGDWNHIGGKWFVVFGLQFYFRYGEGMKGGKYIPFTKLNILFTNEWLVYKNRYYGNKK